jgi:adenylylsulfate kinase
LESITGADRSRLNGHSPAVLWFTGLSGSGKSTIANALERRLFHHFQAHTYGLDGDVIRTGLNRDLDFSESGRRENIRRIGEVTRLFYDAGLIVLTTFISPFRDDRAFARSLIPEGGFIEIYVRCPLAVCETRDPKGHYRRARQGLIPHFTGIDSPYEEPLSPELVLDSASVAVEDCAAAVIEFLKTRQVIQPL